MYLESCFELILEFGVLGCLWLQGPFQHEGFSNLLYDAYGAVLTARFAICCYTNSHANIRLLAEQALSLLANFIMENRVTLLCCFFGGEHSNLPLGVPDDWLRRICIFWAVGHVDSAGCVISGLTRCAVEQVSCVWSATVYQIQLSTDSLAYLSPARMNNILRAWPNLCEVRYSCLDS